MGANGSGSTRVYGPVASFPNSRSGTPFAKLLFRVQSRTPCATGVSRNPLPNRSSGAREELPARGEWRLGIFPIQRVGQPDPSFAPFAIPFVQNQPPAGLLGDRLGGRGRQHDDAVLVPLALPHDNLTALQVHVLDAEPAAFHQSEAGAVHQAGRQAVGFVRRQGVQPRQETAPLPRASEPREDGDSGVRGGRPRRRGRGAARRVRGRGGRRRPGSGCWPRRGVARRER